MCLNLHPYIATDLAPRAATPEEGGEEEEAAAAAAAALGVKGGARLTPA